MSKTDDADTEKVRVIVKAEWVYSHDSHTGNMVLYIPVALKHDVNVDKLFKDADSVEDVFSRAIFYDALCEAHSSIRAFALGKALKAE